MILAADLDVQHGLGRPLDRNYTLFEADDETSWLFFVVIFFGLLFADSAVFFYRPFRMTFKSALAYTLFWVICAMAFCGWLGFKQGLEVNFNVDVASLWWSGYTLQWMMSFDNLFVFHLIFKVYGTPDELKRRPLFLGIMGQVIFTFTLLTVGEWLFHTLFFLHMVFGAFFIYIGVTSVMGDDDDDDPTKNPMIVWLQDKLPFVNIYDTEGHFFVRLPVDSAGQAFIPDHAYVTACETDPMLASKSQELPGTPRSRRALIDLSKIDVEGKETVLRATMLCLVVCTMEISDVIFSVDTIVAISVQVGDLYLAFTCVAFALLTLRATFFILEVLVQMFSLMKYGIALILVYIGIKLIIDRWYLVPHLFDCFFLLVAFGGSILASHIHENMEKKGEGGSAGQLLSNTSALAPMVP